MTVLPQLVDCRTLMDELGVKRDEAEKIMRACPRQHTGTRRWYVRRDDVKQHLDERYGKQAVA